MNSKKNRLTPVEWEIMEAIWEIGGSPSVRQVVDSRFNSGGKAYTTIQTIMNKLVEKGMLRSEKIGLVNFYTPNKTRRSQVKSEVGAMVNRVLNGSAPALANYLIDSEKLTLAEIDKLKELVAAKEAELVRGNDD